MKNFSSFHQVIHERMTNPNANYYEVPWWEAEIRQFTADIHESIRFIECECTDEELYWLSEVFEDIVDRTRSVEFVKCLQERVRRVANPEWKRSVLDEINGTLDYVDMSMTEN